MSATGMPAVYRVRTVPKPWGREEIFALVEGKFCGKLLYVDVGQSLSLQYHAVKEEVIAVHQGFARLEVGAEQDALTTLTLRPGDCVHLTPGTIHRVTALDDLVLVEASTTELDDVVRLEDRYGRKGTSAA